MDDFIEDILEKYGNLLKREIQKNLDKTRTNSPGFNKNAYSSGRNPEFAVNKPKSPFGIGNLSKSVEITIEDNTLQLSMADYWKYVEYGVPPKPQYLNGKGSGQSQLIPALMLWARSKGLPEGAAFAIRKNIWKYGIAPTNFYGTALDNVAEFIARDFGDEADDYIDEFFDRLFD